MAGDLRVGLIGAGVFGGYHGGKVAEATGAVLIGVFDADAGRAGALAGKYGTDAASSEAELFGRCDAVIIAAPAPSHFALVKAALQAGLHVLVEKPLAMTGAEARTLATMAGAGGRILQVGHQERLVCDRLGLMAINETPRRIDMVRAGPPPAGGRAMDVSVIWDLMIHDIDLAHCLLGPDATALTAAGMAQLGAQLDEATASVSIDGCPVHLHASRVASERERKMSLHYDSGEIVIDFLERSVMNSSVHGVNAAHAVLDFDPLGAADRAFIAACRGEAETPIPGQSAVHSVVTAEKLEKLARADLARD